MEITKEENQKLQLAKQIFKVQELTKEQAEFTLGRKLKIGHGNSTRFHKSENTRT